MPETPLVERLFPSTYHRGHPILVWIGILATFTAVFIKLWTPISVNRWPEALYTLTFFVALYQNWSWLKKDRIIQLFGLAILLPILFFGINYLRDPATALEYQSLDKLAKLFFFVPIAWWLGGNPRTIGWFLTTAFAGLVLASALDPNLTNTINRLFAGRRIDFNILNAQHVALYYSLALIGFLSFAPRWLSRPFDRSKVMRLVLAIPGISLCVLVVAGTQTRAVWLALFACALLWLGVTAYQAIKHGHSRQLLAPAIILLLISTAAGVWFKDSVSRRLNAENDTINTLIQGDWDNIPYSSIGIRVNTWIEAGRWIIERPLIGWGGNVRQDVIDLSPRFPDTIKERFGHFHNSYIEFALAYGLLGLGLILYLFYWLLGNVSASGYSTTSDRHLSSFTLYSIALLAIVNLFESYLFFWSGVFVVSIMLAPAYSRMLCQRAET